MKKQELVLFLPKLTHAELQMLNNLKQAIDCECLVDVVRLSESVAKLRDLLEPAENRAPFGDQWKFMLSVDKPIELFFSRGLKVSMEEWKSYVDALFEALNKAYTPYSSRLVARGDYEQYVTSLEERLEDS